MTYQPHQSEDGTLKPVGGDLGSSILTAESRAEAPSALRDAAYNQIDRFLRNNLDDADYADYSQALDFIFTTGVGQSHAAQDDAYAEGRKDQQEEDSELLRWAYSKLHHVSFTKQDDALMQDRLKLLLEHGISA
jgi:hypothetical protein